MRCDQPLFSDTTCGLMQQELQEIWDEVGESEPEKDLMLEEIEQQCLRVYRRKLDEAIKCRVQMQQEIAKVRAEISGICSVLGERSLHVVWRAVGGLKCELEAIVSQLEAMKKRKTERKNQFLEVFDQLVKISNEIGTSVEEGLSKKVTSEADLSLKLLEELREQLLYRQAEKRDRQKQIEDQLSVLRSLCLVLGMDFKHIIDEINPASNGSDGLKDISIGTINALTSAVTRLTEVKTKRWEKLQNFATSLIELRSLMDIPMVEQNTFHILTGQITASVSEVTETGMLSTDSLNHFEVEVLRLEKMRSSNLNDLVMKKRSELDDIRRQAHMVVQVTEPVTSDPECLLEQIELEIARAKEEALSRKEILEKAEKWLTACQEECWLEEYNKDDKRFHAGRGAHLTLKRAEKARAMIIKIPALVELLVSRTTAWEVERRAGFLYDGERLLYMLEQYDILRQEKEQERQRQREKKKLQEQLITEKEVLYGTKPSPSSSGKKGSLTKPRLATDGKLSLSGAKLQNSKPEKAAKIELLNQKSSVRQHQYGNGKKQVHGHSTTKHSKLGVSTETREIYLSPFARKPFTPISSKLLSKDNVANKTPQNNTTVAQIDCYNTPISKPLKGILVDGDESKTPATMPIPLPNTPSTACKSEERIEYSFEEIRAGFINPEYIWD